MAALKPVVLLTSDLARARDTAAAVGAAAGLAPVEDARLRELDLGRWQGLTSDEARERYPEEHAAWRRGEDTPRGGGETYRQAGERAAAAVLEHLPTAGTLVAVTHGGTARATLAVLLELPDDVWGRLAPLGNTCWSVLVEGHIGWRLEQHNVGAGTVTGGHDIGGSATRTPDVEPVR